MRLFFPWFNYGAAMLQTYQIAYPLKCNAAKQKISEFVKAVKCGWIVNDMIMNMCLIYMCCYNKLSHQSWQSDPLQPLDQIYSYQNLPYCFTSFFDFSSNSKGRPPGRPHITLYISICFTSHYLFLCEQIITHNNILYNFGIFAPLISISAD